MLTRPAIEALYERLERPLYNVLYRWVWDPEEALDLVQETFMRLWAMRDRVRTETVEPLAYRIGTNLAANRRRRRKLWRMVGLGAVAGRGAAEEGADGALERSEAREAVRRAVLALPERLRRVVLLCESLGIPEGTVGSRRNAALIRLREMLGPGMEP